MFLQIFFIIRQLNFQANTVKLNAFFKVHIF